MLHNTFLFSLEEPTRLPPYAGLLNQGNTCYLNAVIQVLYHLPAFRRSIYAMKNSERDPITLALRKIFLKLNRADSYVSTRALTEAFGWDSGDAWEQQDAHEMMQKLFQCLENISKATGQENFIRDIFYGETTYVTRAVDGVDHVSRRQEGFYDVELLVKGMNSIDESLAQWIQPVVVESVALDINNDGVQSLHTVERRQFFSQLPQVLLIHLNRAYFCTETSAVEMLYNKWTFSNFLDLRPYVLSEHDRVNIVESLETEYELRSVVIHQGTTDSGHYLAYVRIGRQWVCFNDTLVSEVHERCVMQAAHGGKDNIMGNSSGERASLLVYVNKKSKDVLAEKPIPENHEINIQCMEEHDDLKLEDNFIEIVYNYLKEGESLVDMLDGCRCADGVLESVTFQSPPSVQYLYHTMAAHVNQPADKIRIWVYARDSPTKMVCHLLEDTTETISFLFLESLPISNEAAIETSSQGNFFAPVRYISDDDLFFCGIVHSREELKQLMTTSEEQMKCFVCTSGPTIHEVSVDEALIGSNLVLCSESVSNERLLDILQRLKYDKVNLVLLEGISAASCMQFGRLQLDDNTSYADLQVAVFQSLSSAGLSPPASPEHIGFHYQISPNTKGPSLFIVPPDDDNVSKVTLGSLVLFQNMEKILYVRILPAPLSSLDVLRTVVFNLGGGFRPLVFLQKRSYTLGELYSTALEQYGLYILPELVERITHSLQEDKPVLRLLCHAEVPNLKEYVNHRETLPIGPGIFVIDVLAEVKEGFSRINVLFRSRRGGGEYFGFPTNIAISNTYEETGEEIARRVADKIKFTGEAGDISHWIVAVVEKGGDCHTIGSKDLVKNVIKKVRTEVDHLIIDRPRSLLLDAVENSYQECRRSIIIREASHPKVSHQSFQEESLHDTHERDG